MQVCNASVTNFKDSDFDDDGQLQIAIWPPTLEGKYTKTDNAGNGAVDFLAT